MTPERTRKLQNWVTLSREIFELATAGEWDQVTEREAIRREQIHAFFKQPIEPADAERVRSAINEVLEIDSKVRTLSQLTSNEIAHKLKSIRTKAKAVKAYREGAAS